MSAFFLSLPYFDLLAWIAPIPFLWLLVPTL